MTIVTAVVKDRRKRFAGKALNLDIGPGEESAAVHSKNSVSLSFHTLTDIQR